MEMLKAIAIGLPLTLMVTVLALLIGTVVALPLVAGLRSSNRAVWLLTRGIIDLLRGVPPWSGSSSSTTAFPSAS